MNILVVCQLYYPEPFRVDDVCEHLVSLGHNVTVITGLPNYPMGRIYDGYRNGQKRDEIINGVNVHRCFTIGRRNGILFRVLNYYSFAISSTLYSLRIKDDFDIVFVYQLSPVMMANAGIAYKRKHDKKMVLYCLDLWPESLISGGIKNGSLPYKIFDKISKKIYTQADEILITSRSFKQYFVEHFNIGESKIIYAPQYAEDLFSNVKNENNNKQTVDFVFAGNIGKAQDVKTIVEAAALVENEHIRFHIVGDGSEFENVKNLSLELKLNNITFYGRRPVEEMPKFYEMADAMLIVGKDPVIAATLPGKVQSYMAAGKPIIGAIDGETPLVINQAECGFCVAAEDVKMLAKKIDEFSRISAEKKNLLGVNAKKYYDLHFSKKAFFEKLLNSFDSVRNET